MLEALHALFLVDQHEVRVGASIGIALFPEAGDDGGALIKNADAAMYGAKEHGRGRYEFSTAARLATRVRCAPLLTCASLLAWRRIPQDRLERAQEDQATGAIARRPSLETGSGPTFPGPGAGGRLGILWPHFWYMVCQAWLAVVLYPRPAPWQAHLPRGPRRAGT